MDVSGADLFGPGDIVLEVHFLAEVHFRGESLVDESLLPAVGHRELDLPVEPPRPEEGRVQGVGPVGGHDDLHVHRLVEPVHLVQQLDQDPLHLPVRPRIRIEPLRRNGVNLINEHDGGRVLFGQPEDISDHPGAFAEVLLDELAADHADEGGAGLVGDGLGQHGLAGARGPVQEHSSGRVDPDLRVELRVDQGQLDGLLDLLLLDVQPPNVRVVHIRLLRHLHHLHRRVRVWRQDVHHALGRPVQGHTSVWLQLLSIQSRQHSHVVLGTIRRTNYPVGLIYHLDEVAGCEVDTLDTLDFFLGANVFTLQVSLLILQVVFLDLEDFQLGF
mmetsp:Transcript_13562/g.13297  ORF Transcript_13562/g.13297 Transcript_13562/m.13297 type:complete len:330 (-) Transcript_13562:72-1061(-)